MFVHGVCMCMYVECAWCMCMYASVYLLVRGCDACAYMRNVHLDNVHTIIIICT